MEIRGGRGKNLSKTPPHLSDILTVLMPASNITLDPDSLHRSLSGGQCCRLIVTPYHTIITLENLLELCSATSSWSTGTLVSALPKSPVWAGGQRVLSLKGNILFQRKYLWY